MATLNELATAVNTYILAAKNEAKGKINKLNSTASAYTSPATRINIMNQGQPILPEALFLTSNAGSVDGDDKTAFKSAVAAILTRIDNGLKEVSEISAPPNTSLTVNPLSGWIGPDAGLKEPWKDLAHLGKKQWDETALKKSREIIAELLAGATSAPSDEMLSRQAVINSTAIATLRTSSNNRLTRAAIGDLNLMLNNRDQDILRTMTVMLDEHARLQYITAVKQGLSGDELEMMYALTYGRLYAKIADTLLEKAMKESGWFIKDFSARADMYAKSEKLNASLYMDTLKNALDIITTEAETNIKAVSTNFELAVKKAAALLGFEKLDVSHTMDIADIDLAIFKAEIDNLLQYGLEDMDTYMASHKQQVSAMGSLAVGYSALVQTASQGTIAVASAKG